VHLEQLPSEGLEILTRWLDTLQQTRPPIIATYRTSASDEELPAHLLAQFDHVVEIAGLEDRREDIPRIVESVLRDGDGLAVRVEPTAMQQLMSRDWPGNVRQLRRVVLEARNNCTARTIRAVDLPQEYRGGAGHKTLSRLEQAERAAIAAVIAAADGNKRTTAAQLGISRSTLYRKMAALGLDS
jgi:transcriptional regulator of acetoin/glycerol metabolism